MINATKMWSNKVRQVFSDMLSPLNQAFKDGDDKVVADELQYYLNCNTCTEMVSKLRESPNDELLVNIIMTVGINMCSEIWKVELCSALATKFKANIMTHFFKLLITDEFICSYLMPLCADNKYEELLIQDFAWRVLKNKPLLISDDDFLNQIYRQIHIDSTDGTQRPTFRVL